MITNPPDSFEKRVVLTEGMPLLLRASSPADAEGLQTFSHTFSAQTFFRIIFKSLRAASSTQIDRYLHNEYPQRLTLLALSESGSPLNPASRVVGVAHFWQDPLEGARLTIVVGDCWQRRGIGKALLLHLVPIAQAAKITRLRTFFSADNHGMRLLLEQCGFAPRAVTNCEDTWEISLAENNHQPCPTQPKGDSP